MEALTIEEKIQLPSGELVSTAHVITIASRLQKTYQIPKKYSGETDEHYTNRVVQPHEFNVVVELALAEGFNPLGKGFHYFKYNGAINIMEHYAPLLNWAQSKEPCHIDWRMLNESEKLSLPGIGKGDFVCEATLIKRADQPAYNDRLKLVLGFAKEEMSFTEALQLARREADNAFATKATGVVRYSEVYSDSGKLIYGATPTGWVPGETRAQIRAIRQVIKLAYGVPTAGERVRLGLAIGDEVELPPERVAELAARIPSEIPAEHTDKYIQLEQVYEEAAQKINGMTPEERVTSRQEREELLHGKSEEVGIGDVSEGDYTELVDPLAELSQFEAKELGLQAQRPDDLGEEPGLPDIVIEKRNIGDVRASLLKSGYASTKAQDALIAKLYPGQKLGELSQLQWHNAIEYGKRSQLLDNAEIEIPKRLELVPEIHEAVEKPTTITAAKEFILKVVQVSNRNNIPLRSLEEFSLD